MLNRARTEHAAFLLDSLSGQSFARLYLVSAGPLELG